MRATSTNRFLWICALSLPWRAAPNAGASDGNGRHIHPAVPVAYAR